MGQYFVGVGGQKCGTSWLGNHLYRHPQVFSHSIKEMHVFDSLASEPERAYRTAQVQEILVELAAELARAEAAGRGDPPQRGARAVGRATSGPAGDPAGA